MKAKEIVEIKTEYSFEAPLIPALIDRFNQSSSDEFSLLDLNDHLAPNPKEMYLVRVSGESMIDENIFDGDILVVNRKESPKNGKVVIASLNGEMAVKTLRLIDDKVYLFSANKKFLPLEISEYMRFEIQGVVKHVIHQM